MTGLCGWIGTNRPRSEAAALLARMLERVPDLPNWTETVFVSDTSALAVRAPPGREAIAESNGVTVACAGDLSWRDNALSRIASESGDPRALMEAYRAHGPELLRLLRGSFALVVLDRQKKQALLAVDRFGQHALCYAQGGEELAFGTTADSVVRHPAIKPEVSTQAIYNYLYCHMVPSPGTIYRDVRKLLPAQSLGLDDGRLRSQFYWLMKYEDAAPRDFESAAGELHDLLRESVARSLDTEQVGAFLSGGTDSSTITGMLTQLRGRPVDTYSIGFDADGFDETRYARITARHFGARAHEYYVTPGDVADAIPRIAAAYDEPFGNASAVPTYYCARAAFEDGRALMLAGDGGDEIFGGNARYAKQLVFESYSRIPSGLRRTVIEPALLGLPALARVPLLGKAASYVRQARVALPDRLEAYNLLERDPIDEILEPGFLQGVDLQQPSELAREAYQRATSYSVINRMMHLDLKQTLADNDLRKVNRMCQLAGIRVRYPMLDDDLVEFSGRIRPSWKVRGVKLRWFFKQALRDFLPPETIAKTKHGFGLPFGLWLTRDSVLMDLTRASLLSLKRRGIVRDTYLDRLANLHRSDHATYYGVMIWVLLMLEQWFQSRRL